MEILVSVDQNGCKILKCLIFREWYSLNKQFFGFPSEFGFFVTCEPDIISNNMIISMGKY